MVCTFWIVLMCWCQKWFLKNKKTSLIYILAWKVIWKTLTTTLSNKLEERNSHSRQHGQQPISKYIHAWLLVFILQWDAWCALSWPCMVTMSLPRMSPPQYYRAILLLPVKYPKPHDSTRALSSDYIPSLWLMHSQAFVTDALSMSSCHLFQSPLPLEWSIGAQDCKYAFAAELIDMHGKQEIIVQQEFFISLQHKVLFLSSINLQTSLDSRNIIKKKRCISWVMRNT